MELERETATTAPPATPSAPRHLLVLGTGRAGGAIAGTARAAGFTVHTAGREGPPADLPGEGLAVLVCVPDGAIRAACAALLGAVPRSIPIGHVSGASTLAELGAAADAGHPTFSLHPLQTIPGPETKLAGSSCAIAGSDAPTLGLARSLGVALGMRPFTVPEENRAAYHAAASIASNFLVALEESAAGLLAAAGVADGREALAPLVRRSAENWARTGGRALTGPIARGDDETVARQRRAIAALLPELLPLYEALAARTRGLLAEDQA